MGMAVVPADRWRVRGEALGASWIWNVENPYVLEPHVHGIWQVAISCAQSGGRCR